MSSLLHFLSHRFLSTVTHVSPGRAARTVKQRPDGWYDSSKISPDSLSRYLSVVPQINCSSGQSPKIPVVVPDLFYEKKKNQNISIFPLNISLKRPLDISKNPAKNSFNDFFGLLGNSLELLWNSWLWWLRRVPKEFSKSSGYTQTIIKKAIPKHSQVSSYSIEVS